MCRTKQTARKSTGGYPPSKYLLPIEDDVAEEFKEEIDTTRKIANEAEEQLDLFKKTTSKRNKRGFDSITNKATPTSSNETTESVVGGVRRSSRLAVVAKETVAATSVAVETKTKKNAKKAQEDEKENNKSEDNLLEEKEINQEELEENPKRATRTKAATKKTPVATAKQVKASKIDDKDEEERETSSKAIRSSRPK